MSENNNKLLQAALAAPSGCGNTEINDDLIGLILAFVNHKITSGQARTALRGQLKGTTNLHAILGCKLLTAARRGRVKLSTTNGTEQAEDSTAWILLRTIAAEAERTGSWTVPHDIQERIHALLKGRP